jgi:hypothetical protein
MIVTQYDNTCIEGDHDSLFSFVEESLLAAPNMHTAGRPQRVVFSPGHYPHHNVYWIG